MPDNILRPSERFIAVVSDYFLKNEYTFKKSQNSFVKPFSKGFYNIKLWFRIGVLTNVTFSWWLFFEKLAKLNALLSGHPKRYKDAKYMPTDLRMHTRWENNFEHTWALYDQASLTYTDISINQAAENFIRAYEFYVPNYFEYFSRYESLEKDYNQEEFKSITGLILAKYFDRPDFEKLMMIYTNQVALRETDPIGREHLVLKKFIDFISTNDIKKFL